MLHTNPIPQECLRECPYKTNDLELNCGGTFPLLDSIYIVYPASDMKSDEWVYRVDLRVDSELHALFSLLALNLPRLRIGIAYTDSVYHIYWGYWHSFWQQSTLHTTYNQEYSLGKVPNTIMHMQRTRPARRPPDPLTQPHNQGGLD